MISVTHSLQIARYLISDCGDADHYRALYLGRELTPDMVDPIHAEEILSRWGKLYADAIDDIAYQNAVFCAIPLLFDTEEEVRRLKNSVCQIFLDWAWEDLPLGCACAEHVADIREEAELARHERKIA